MLYDVQRFLTFLEIAFLFFVRLKKNKVGYDVIPNLIAFFFAVVLIWRGGREMFKSQL